MLKRLCMSILLIISCGRVNAMAVLPPLHEAAKAGDLSRVRQLIAEDRSLIDQLDEDHCTPLEVALQYGNPAFHHADDPTEIAHVLIAAGTDVNHLTCGGLSPLHHAISSGLQAAVPDLIAAGANVNHPNQEGKTPLYFAISHEAVAYTSDQKAAQYHIAQDLIAAGAYLYITDKHGRTPLAHAQYRDSQSMVDLLADHQQRIQEALQRAPIIASTLVMATHPRLGAGSLTILDQNLLRHISQLATEAELYAARQPR